MRSWHTATLAEVATVVGRGITPRYADHGAMIVVNQRCIRDGRVDLGPSRLHDSNSRPVVGEKLLRPGDILVNSTGVGTLGRTAPVKSLGASATVDSHVTIVRPNSTTDGAWLGYALSLAESEIESMAEGSTGQTELSRHRLALLTLKVPPLDEQRAIAATLGALDDKIEANRRLVDLIPRLIRAMVFDALGAHPGVVAVSDIATFVNGGAYTKGASGTGRIVIRIAELNSGPGGSTVYSDIDVPEEKTARAGDILMSWSGSLGLYRWFRDEAIVNQHIFKVLPSDGYPSWLVFDRLDTVMPVFQAIAKDKATTMGHIQRGHLETTTVEIPTPETIDLLGGLIAPLWQRLLLAEREVVELTALRDALLPELLSGRIRVPEADGAVA